MLMTYEDFIKRVNTLGFMLLSDAIPGLPSVSKETLEQNWHTGDKDTDPWQWKDRVAEEKRLAFGCIINGHKGFVSPDFYGVFYKAYHPGVEMEERMADGRISQVTYQLWQLFNRDTMLNTSDIRKKMGVGKKESSQVDRAIIELQKNFYLTVAGNRCKTDMYGKPYGWPANVYDKVENWVPSLWLQDSGLTQAFAKARILDSAEIMAQGEISRSQLARKLNL